MVWQGLLTTVAWQRKQRSQMSSGLLKTVARDGLHVYKGTGAGLGCVAHILEEKSKGSEVLEQACIHGL